MTKVEVPTGGRMKKILLVMGLACGMSAMLVGCGSGQGDTQSSSATGSRRPMAGTVNEPSGSPNPSQPTPGSNTMGTARPHSYESTSTPEKKNP
jgi:hypothetical protein